MYSRTSGIQMLSCSIKCLRTNSSQCAYKMNWDLKHISVSFAQLKSYTQTHFSTTKPVVIIPDIDVDTKILKSNSKWPRKNSA